MTAQAPGRGCLKVFLGYAAGVGKTYQMITEARELRARGVDVVIGYFEPHGRRDTMALTEGLEMVPTRTIEYRGSTFPEMDTDAVLARLHGRDIEVHAVTLYVGPATFRSIRTQRPRWQKADYSFGPRNRCTGRIRQA